MKATTTPMLNIQWLGTANISSTNQKCHISLTPMVNMVARYPMMVIFNPVFIELFGPLKIGTLLSYIATNPQPNGRAIKWLYNHQWAGVNALSLIAVWCNDPSTKLSTSTDAAIEPNIMTIMYIFFNLWISTSFGISAGIWAIYICFHAIIFKNTSQIFATINYIFTTLALPNDNFFDISATYNQKLSVP